jgi:hypothetical protein
MEFLCQRTKHQCQLHISGGCWIPCSKMLFEGVRPSCGLCTARTLDSWDKFKALDECCNIVIYHGNIGIKPADNHEMSVVVSHLQQAEPIQCLRESSQLRTT